MSQCVLCATRGDLSPEDRIRTALRAAAEHSPTVAGPFDVIFQEAP